MPHVTPHLHTVGSGEPFAEADVTPADAAGTREPPRVLGPEDDGAAPHRRDAVTPPSGWAQGELADEDDAAHRRHLVGAFAVLALITAADLVLIKGTFNRVLRESEALSWILGGSLTLAAVVGAFGAGSLTRKAVAAPRTRGAQVAFAVTLLVGWTALGVGMFYLRWRAADFASGQVAYEGVAASSGLQDVKEQVLAFVLAGVYLATGALALHDGYSLTNPAAAAMRHARARVEKLRPVLQAKEGRVARLRENLAVHRHDLESVDEARDVALAARAALAAELKEYARVQIALHLGDPASTGLVRPAAERAAPGAVPGAGAEGGSAPVGLGIAAAGHDPVTAGDDAAPHPGEDGAA